jgi:hypothetical protein
MANEYYFENCNKIPKNEKVFGITIGSIFEA